MQVKVSPALVTLLESDEPDEQSEVLIRLWREVKKQVKQQNEMLPVKKQAGIVPKRARFSFD